MAQIEKRTHPSGKITYRVRLRLQGMPDLSSSFSTRTHAKEWARREAELKSSRYFPRDEGKNRTFDAFIDLYLVRVMNGMTPLCASRLGMN